MALTRGLHLPHTAEPLSIISDWSSTTSMTQGTNIKPMVWDFGKNDMIWFQTYPIGNVFFSYSINSDTWGRMASVTMTNGASNMTFDFTNNRIWVQKPSTSTNGLYYYTIPTKTASSGLTAYATYQETPLIHVSDGLNVSVVSNDFMYSFRSGYSQKYSISGNSWSAIANQAFNSNLPIGSAWPYTSSHDLLYVVDTATTITTFGMKLWSYSISGDSFSAVADNVHLIPHMEQVGCNYYANIKTVTYSGSKIYIGAWYDGSPYTGYLYVWEINPSTITDNAVVSPCTRIPVSYTSSSWFNYVYLVYVKVGGQDFLYCYSGHTSGTTPMRFYRVPIY